MLSQKEIVVVEDNDCVRQSIELLAEHSGYLVRSFATAEELLAIELGQPPLMIFDFLLPGLDGINLLKQIRAQGYDVPAIIMSGKFDSHANEVLTDLGNAVWLQKPFQPEEFIAIIDRAIRLPVGSKETV